MPDVFLSYKREDLTAASRLVEGLRAAGLDVWWDKDIPAAAPWEATIERMLADAKVVLVCWSRAAVASENVRSEARWAREQGRLIQLFVEPCSPPLFFGERQGIDLSDWSGDPADARFGQVASAINERLGRDSTLALKPPAADRREHDRLTREGGGRLGNVSETPPASAPEPHGGVPAPRRPPKGLVLTAAAGAVLVLGAGFLWLARGDLPLGGSSESRLAILPFETLGEGAPAGFAQSLLDKVLGAMTASEVQVLPQTDTDLLREPNRASALRQLGVTLLLGGSVRADAGTLSVTAHLEDPRHHIVLWTTAASAPVAEANDLEQRVAAKVTSVLLCADDLQHAPSAPKDADTVSLFFQACDLSENMAGDLQLREQVLDILNQVIARAPNFARGYSRIAYVLADRYRFMPEDEGDQRYQQAMRAARLALKIDSHDGEAYLALSMLAPVADYRSREQLLLNGLAAEPTDAELDWRYAELLAEVGRVQEATTYSERAAAHAVLNSTIVEYKAYYEGAAGHLDDAWNTIEEAARIWPNSLPIWSIRLSLATWAGRWKDAEAILGERVGQLEPGTAKFLGMCLQALSTGSSDRVAAVADLAPKYAAAGQVQLDQAIECVAQNGRLDDAFALAARYNPRVYGLDGPAAFFFPSTAAMRRDRRFMTLSARLGLLDYWRSTGKWPDFCSEPGLPYDCKAEAAKLASARP